MTIRYISEVIYTYIFVDIITGNITQKKKLFLKTTELLNLYTVKLTEFFYNI